MIVWRVRFVVGLLAACAALTGCEKFKGPESGQIGGVEGESGRCDEQERVIGKDETSSLGFAARDVLSGIAGERSAELTWAKGGTTTVTLSVGTPTEVRFVHSTPAVGGAEVNLEAAENCLDHLEIDAPVAFSTADSAFAESLSVVLVASRQDEASFSEPLELDALHGSYRVTEVDPSQFDDIRVWLDATLDEAGITGELVGHAQSSSGDGPESAVSLDRFDIAEF